MNNIRRMAALLLTLLALCMGAAGAETHTQLVYGQSEKGRDLICHRVGREEAERSLMMVFGVHGYEDAFDRDGEVLRRIAQTLLAHYETNVDALGSFCLYVVPTANPDGLLEGTSKDGFGRCNANGIDINRDFSSDWSRQTNSRNRTGRAPFSTAEARAIRDLVTTVQPDYAMDVHGWCELAFGNGKLAQTFAEPFGFEVRRLCGGGMVCAWMNTVTRESMMLELPPNPNLNDYVTDTANRLIAGIDAWTASFSGK